MSQTVHLQGGFGEKGRTSIGIDDGDTFLMLDAGIKVGAPDDSYHPRLARPAAEIGAVLITHAHEDHIGGLCWLLGQGYRGAIWMTDPTRDEMQPVLEQYARPEDLRRHPVAAERIRTFRPGDTLTIGGHRILTGHSGHVAGGVWACVASGGRRTLYCGDLLADSKVFPMTPLPDCDLALLDCSYGDDPVPYTTRAGQVADWIAAHPASVLPSPLSGRSLELLTFLPEPFAIATGMAEPLLKQLADDSLLVPGVAEHLRRKLARARIWEPGTPLPVCPLLVHDGMGTAGPSCTALEQAAGIGHPVLLTGHLPEGSPGQIMHRAGQAEFLRLPTHPTLPQTLAIWDAAGRPAALGHSCDGAALTALARHLPQLDTAARTGDTLRNGQD